MDAYLFPGLFLLLLIGIPVGIGLLLFFFLKRIGHPKTACYLTIGYGIIVLTLTLLIVFEDQLFTKNSAYELINEHGIELNNEFELIHNESSSAIGDYNHTFTLRISENDKQKAIFEIKNADNFQPADNSIDHLLYFTNKKKFGPKSTLNYETENSYVRQKGFTLNFTRISIDKEINELTFEINYE